jgi:hypothetical protein
MQTETKRPAARHSRRERLGAFERIGAAQNILGHDRRRARPGRAVSAATALEMYVRRWLMWATGGIVCQRHRSEAQT